MPVPHCLRVDSSTCLYPITNSIHFYLYTPSLSMQNAMSWVSYPPFFTSSATSLINLIKRPRIPKTAPPNLIHNPHSLHIIPTTLPRRHTQRRPPSHTLLQLLRNIPLSPREELPCKSTLPTQHTRSNLHTRRMSQIFRVHFKSQMIIRVHHFMREGIF